MPFSCPPIKNAPQGHVGGRWEWRLGSFQRPPSIIQRAVWFTKWTGIYKPCASLFVFVFVLGFVGFLIFQKDSTSKCKARCSQTQYPIPIINFKLKRKRNASCRLGLSHIESAFLHWKHNYLSLPKAEICEVSRPARRVSPYILHFNS